MTYHRSLEESMPFAIVVITDRCLPKVLRVAPLLTLKNDLQASLIGDNGP